MYAMYVAPCAYTAATYHTPLLQNTTYKFYNQHTASTTYTGPSHAHASCFANSPAKKKAQQTAAILLRNSRLVATNLQRAGADESIQSLWAAYMAKSAHSKDAAPGKMKLEVHRRQPRVTVMVWKSTLELLQRLPWHLPAAPRSWWTGNDLWQSSSAGHRCLCRSPAAVPCSAQDHSCGWLGLAHCCFCRPVSGCRAACLDTELLFEPLHNFGRLAKALTKQK